MRGWGGGSRDLFLLGDPRSPSAVCSPAPAWVLRAQGGWSSPTPRSIVCRTVGLWAHSCPTGPHLRALPLPCCWGLASHSRAQPGGGHRARRGGAGWAQRLPWEAGGGCPSWPALLPGLLGGPTWNGAPGGVWRGPWAGACGRIRPGGWTGAQPLLSVPRGWPPQPRPQPQPLCRGSCVGQRDPRARPQGQHSALQPGAAHREDRHVHQGLLPRRTHAHVEPGGLGHGASGTTRGLGRLTDLGVPSGPPEPPPGLPPQLTRL